MSDEIYTKSLRDQSDSEALNSVLWRLAVATGLAKRGGRRIKLNVDEVIALAEERLSIYNG